MKPNVVVSKKPHGASEGYSLFEVLCCIAIIAVISRGALLCSQSLRDSFNLRSSLHQTLALCNLASYNARRTGLATSLIASATHRELNVITSQSPKPLQSLRLPRGVHIEEFVTGTVSNKDEFQFYEDGSVSAGRIVLASDWGGRCHIMQALRGARRSFCQGAP